MNTRTRIEVESSFFVTSLCRLRQLASRRWNFASCSTSLTCSVTTRSMAAMRAAMAFREVPSRATPACTASSMKPRSMLRAEST